MLMVLTAMALTAAPAFATHRNCPDFDTWRQAQRYFQNANHTTSDLDVDDDGDACETLQGYSPGATVGDGNDNDPGDDDDNAPPADNGDDDGEDPGEMPDTSTPSGTAPLLPMMLVGLFGGSALLLYRKRLAL